MKRISIPTIRHNRETGKTVKYTPCSKHDLNLGDDLDEIAVISNAAPENVKYGTGSLTANGPRVVPGIITSTGMEHSRLVNEKRSSSSTRLPISPPLYTTKSFENLKSKSASRQSLLETASSKLHGRDHKQRSRESITFSHKTHMGSELEISRKVREHRRKEIKREFEKWETSTSSSEKDGCNWTFVFDPSGSLSYYWSMIVSVAFLYNFWVVIFRFAFNEIKANTIVAWLTLDYFADILYALDIVFHFRTGYLEEGVLQTDTIKLRHHYMNSTLFYIDCLCLLPIDFLYLSIGFNSILRCLRLVKIYRFWTFLDRTERHTNYPNVFRTVILTHYVLVIFHWNACLFHIISVNGGFGTRSWFNPRDETCNDVVCEYLRSFYWSTLALTTIGDLPSPRTKGEYLFLVVELVFGLFLFAAVLGHVANIVTNVSTARKEFQARLDVVKTYMRMRRVPDHLQNKVIKWFDYLWVTQKSSDEDRSVGFLPDKLKAEIAIHVHLNTLKQVEIFQNTEAGFLCELVLRLRPVLFSPGDYICRKGEVGKEMYIVNRGRLEVVTDNGKTVLATLRAGSYFGEISILNMSTTGNRRTASVRSVGYSDLFCLNKQDMWDVLKDYPAARDRLESIAVKRLEKYRKDPLQNIAMSRSHSTPGLLESHGQVPLENMPLYPREPSTTASAATLLSDDECRQNVRATASGTRSRRTSVDDIQQRGTPLYEQIEPTLRSSFPTHTGAQRSGGRLYLVESSLDRQLVATTTSHTDLFTPLPPSPYFVHSSSHNTFDVSPVSDYSAMSSTGVDRTIYSSHSPHVPVPSPIYVSHIGRVTPHSDRDSHPESLVTEIKRLRERLMTLETENASMGMKLSHQQWEVENRLAEIELQVCGTGGETSPISCGSTDENERNRESVI
ncbi:cyclic nucleotide-gated cation channel alpha-3-like [Limulus polyphemus]|uniref:Cyclic nucleotide-gated cation channel alpha-3-like n=1 Tax=Limulus polyphemus TaxID=6850 RepID=O97119_LIMPO|nr:cyclic nucleotide-gated cation channel alpha-3-like [Limulus polyphemus]AAD16099.2 cyclic nucleotide-gated ion channel LCNG1 [Limulus polyphemus]